MVKGPKISFLMAAHNEEKVIGKALENLSNLPYENYEVILGLDGCDDKTEEIVKGFCKRSSKFKYYSLNLRQGKPIVINFIIEKATGEIVIIHDADWIFRFGKREDFGKMMKLFEDSRIGGIAESFPVHYLSGKWGKKSLLERGVIWSSYIWMDYVKKEYTKKAGNKLILDKEKMKFPLLVNIFRKRLYKKNVSLGDDFERCVDILEEGYEVVIPQKESEPRMIAYEEKINLEGLLKQKERTALAREQIRKKYGRSYKLDKGFYVYLIKFMSKMKIVDFFGLILYIFVFSFGSVKSKFSREESTTQAWQKRLKR